LSDESKFLIKTSTEGWLKDLADAYKTRANVFLRDDAHVGIDPKLQTILEMGRRAGVSRKEWAAILIALGVASVGAWMIVMAILDPEPFSKIAMTVAAGAVLLGSGGFSAIRILTNHKPPNVRVSANGEFEIYWN